MVRRLSYLWCIGRVAFVLAVLTALAWPANAQVVGQIQGTVTDAQGGVLPGVSLTLRNTETGAARSAVTETDGVYRFDRPITPGMRLTFIEVGAYSLSKATMFNGLALPSVCLRSEAGEIRELARYEYEDFRRIAGDR